MMEAEIKIELKYCERCGGLWLRRIGSSEVYCVSCAPEMRQMAVPKKKPCGTRRWDGSAHELGGVACA
jgi:Zn-finger nucleic acid-binding protein